jgi:hypothetical protein
MYSSELARSKGPRAPTDLRNRLHHQHPQPGPRIPHGSHCGPAVPGVPIGCRSPRKRGPYSMPIHTVPAQSRVVLLSIIGGTRHPCSFFRCLRPAGRSYDDNVKSVGTFANDWDYRIIFPYSTMRSTSSSGITSAGGPGRAESVAAGLDLLDPTALPDEGVMRQISMWYIGNAPPRVSGRQ